MRKIREVVILSEVAHDLNNGKEFYNRSEPGVGDYFWDSLIADMKSLIIYGGVHHELLTRNTVDRRTGVADKFF